ncbi:MAG TPA: phosphoribosylanthranilate isomerase [Polyangiaceae bacterium]|nr:phosphoribosylanthranilate isomerase [Polyangiaceae bacterium]
MRTRLKVCCISSHEEAACAVALGASALGLVADMPSGPGVIDDELIASIARSVPPPVSRFLLTSRVDGAAIAAHALACGVDTVQLVDRVDEAAYAAIRGRAPHLRIVQVLHVEGDDVIEDAARICPHVDAILLDSGRPGASVRELGGTGRVHDWELSRRIVGSSTCPIFLAGGLSPANATAAIRQVRPFGLDVCTGLRTRGHLDPVKLAKMVAAIESTDAAILAELAARDS